MTSRWAIAAAGGQLSLVQGRPNRVRAPAAFGEPVAVHVAGARNHPRSHRIAIWDPESPLFLPAPPLTRTGEGPGEDPETFH